MSDIIRWSAVETVARLRAREVSAVEVTEAHLARLEQVNPALNAVVDGVPIALNRAAAIDAGQVEPGLLFGAPVTTKINTDQAGVASTNGLPAMQANIARGDAGVVHSLKAAGGVVIGRSNAPEFSMRWCTSNPLHGATLNPWNAATTPGGSSGGAAAAVAAGIGVIAQGNDLGGSVRYPAYCCGLVGLRPSRGRIANFNPTAPGIAAPMTAAMAVQGPLARSVADVRLGLAAMRGFAWEDPAWSAAAAYGRSRTGWIGVAATLFEDTQHSTVRAAMGHAERAAAAAGLRPKPVALPQAERICTLWGQLLFTELEVLSKAEIADTGSEPLHRWIADFSTYFSVLNLEGYMKGIAERVLLQRAWNEMFQDVDAVILPTSLLPPVEADFDFKQPERAATLIDAQRPLLLANFLGLPALALPTHVADGLPSGVQIVAPMHDDDALLDIGAKLEAELGSVLAAMPAPFAL
ncbi:MAG: amidase [Pseudomonadota bacterium]